MCQCCYTFASTFFKSKIINHETDLLPLTWNSFLEKTTLNFVNVCISSLQTMLTADIMMLMADIMAGLCDQE